MKIILHWIQAVKKAKVVMGLEMWATAQVKEAEKALVKALERDLEKVKEKEAKVKAKAKAKAEPVKQVAQVRAKVAVKEKVMEEMNLAKAQGMVNRPKMENQVRVKNVLKKLKIKT